MRWVVCNCAATVLQLQRKLDLAADRQDSRARCALAVLVKAEAHAHASLEETWVIPRFYL